MCCAVGLHPHSDLQGQGSKHLGVSTLLLDQEHRTEGLELSGCPDVPELGKEETGLSLHP